MRLFAFGRKGSDSQQTGASAAAKAAACLCGAEGNAALQEQIDRLADGPAQGE